MEQATQAIQEWLNIRTTPEFIAEFEAAHPGKTWPSWEVAREQHLQMRQAFANSHAYTQYNQPSSARSKVTKFGRLTKTKQRELINKHGDIFYTHVADAPVTLEYGAWHTPTEVMELFNCI